MGLPSVLQNVEAWQRMEQLMAVGLRVTNW
jgi:hypothetical protein